MNKLTVLILGAPPKTQTATITDASRVQRHRHSNKNNVSSP
jgi:hypothetical protein